MCARVSGRSWQWWRVCWFRMGGTIKRSVRDWENYVSVIVNHGWRADGESQRRQARGAACVLLSLSFYLPHSLSLHLVAIRISVVRGENEEGGRGGWGVTGNRRV